MVMPARSELPAGSSAWRSAILTDTELKSGLSYAFMAMMGALFNRSGGIRDIYLEYAGPSGSTAMRGVDVRRVVGSEFVTFDERTQKVPAGTIGMNAVIC